MRVTFDTKYFAERLALINKTLGKAIIPVLEGVLVESDKDASLLWLRGADLETEIHTQVVAEVGKPGTAVLPRKILAEMARTWPEDEVTLEVDEEGLRAVLTCGEARLELSTYNPEEFPATLATVTGDTVFYNVPIGVLTKMAKQVAVAVARSNAFGAFSGLLWEDRGDGHVSVVATDTHRMAWMEADIERDEGRAVRVIIPAQAISTIAAPGENVTCELSESYAKFTSQQASVTARLIGATFPDWRQVIMRDPAVEVRCDSDKLISAVQQAALLAREESSKDRANLVRLGLAGNEIVVFAEASGLGTLSSIVPAEKSGKDIVIIYNILDLLDGLKIYKGSDIKIKISSDELQAIIEPADEDGTHYLVVPVTMRGE
jgi:DNA polymerase-3 subunit beta